MSTATDDRMKATWPLVARREIAVKLHDRNFLISTGALVLILAAVLGVQALLAGRTSTTTVAVASSTAAQVVGQADGTAKAAGSDVAFKTKSYPSDAAVRSAVAGDKQSVGLVRSGDGWRLIGGSDRSAIVTTDASSSARSGASSAMRAAISIRPSIVRRRASATASASQLPRAPSIARQPATPSFAA